MMMMMNITINLNEIISKKKKLFKDFIKDAFFKRIFQKCLRALNIESRKTNLYINSKLHLRKTQHLYTIEPMK